MLLCSLFLPSFKMVFYYGITLKLKLLFNFRGVTVLVASHIYHDSAFECQLDFEPVPCDPAGTPEYNDNCSLSFNVTCRYHNTFKIEFNAAFNVTL